MGKTLKEKLEQLSPERRKKIEEEANFLIAEEMLQQQLRTAIELTHQTNGINSSNEEESVDIEF
jgi:hypothetical protein